MTFSNEIRRLAWRTKYLGITVLLLLYAVAALVLQFVVFPDNKELANFANWSVGILFVADLGILSIVARRNLYQFRLHILNSAPHGA